MSSKIPESNPGKHTGSNLFHHQRTNITKILARELDFESLRQSIIRQDISQSTCRTIDLSALPQIWSHDGGSSWTNVITGEQVISQKRPGHDRGIILADEMDTGKSLTILAVIEATLVALQEWFKVPLLQGDTDEPSIRLPTGWDDSQIILSEALPEARATKRSKIARESAIPSSEDDPTKAGMHKCRATMIVCPKSIVDVWEITITAHWKGRRFSDTFAGPSPEIEPEDTILYTYNHFKNKEETDVKDLINPSIVLTSYEALLDSWKNSGPIHQLAYYRVILDEGHRAKNSGSQTFKAIRALQYRHLHIVSGTSVQNRLDELCSYLQLLDVPSNLPKFSYFKKICIEPALDDEQPDSRALRELGRIFTTRHRKIDSPELKLPRKYVHTFYLPENKHLPDTLVTHAYDMGPCKLRFVEKYVRLTAEDSMKIHWLRYFAQEDCRQYEKVVLL
ncbi:hypothetical protein I302_106951 [Kwoniella bestiolae CBS 10118]|uniref:Helicase ATP-binding domain-containing protein n=1 Tax=Kwoniella bestiolae CBS 10118 TaxID=1296100 RepID=A0A1B9FZX0_9TREE|nr:hypothetical protein I302_05783 [Kwoniella bestiolae CBS 10118]OCF24324.1 hypothetical protein I302_05783 [Kwoniella bestiolae CBS 10118]